MDPNNPAQPSAPLRPMNEPHTPISESEMNPNPGHASRSGKGTLLTLASLLVLAGIVGITLWLYIQNRTNTDKNTAETSQDQAKNQEKPLFIALKNGTQMVSDVKSAEDNPDKAGYLDLSMQDVKAVNFSEFVNVTTLILTGNKLKEIPNGVYELSSLVRLEVPSNNIENLSSKVSRLRNLKILNLTGNRLTSLPKEIGELSNLESLYLTDNQLTELPTTITNLKNLKELRLSNNKITQSQIDSIKRELPNTTITFEPSPKK